MHLSMRRHPNRRRVTRSIIRCTALRHVRRSFRQRWRSPDDLAEALRCFRRAIRAHQRLSKLAPHEFDAAVVERDRAEHLERQARYPMIEAALTKVYGPPTPEERERMLQSEWLAAQPPRLHPRTRRAVELEHAQWLLWMEAGRQAWSRHHQRRPHAVPTLGRVARLLAMASDFGRLATGLSH